MSASALLRDVLVESEVRVIRRVLPNGNIEEEIVDEEKRKK